MKKNHLLLLFDFDGVIADSMGLVRVFYNKIHKKYNLPYAYTEQDISKLFYKNVYEGLADAGLPTNKARAFLDDMKKMTFENETLYEPFEGIEDVLRTLHNDNHLMGIISSNHTTIIETFLKKHNLASIFNHLHGAEEKTSKVEKIKQSMNSLRFEEKNTYYIGDTVGDIKEGKEAKVHTVGVSWGYHKKEDLQNAKPTFLFTKPAQLLELSDLS